MGATPTCTTPPPGQLRQLRQRHRRGSAPNHQREVSATRSASTCATSRRRHHQLGHHVAVPAVRRARLPLTVQAHRITRPWKEGTGSCAGDGATWYETEAGQPWTRAGRRHRPGRRRQVDVPAGAGRGSSTTSRSPAWCRPGRTARPEQRRAAAGRPTRRCQAGNSVVYATDDYTASPALRPKLTVNYDDGSVAQGPLVSLAAPRPAHGRQRHERAAGRLRGGRPAGGAGRVPRQRRGGRHRHDRAVRDDLELRVGVQRAAVS